MPFQSRNFNSIGGQALKATVGTPETIPGAPQVWSYRTEDARATVVAPGYFNALRNMLAPGDICFAVRINAAGAVQEQFAFSFNQVPATGNVTVTDVPYILGPDSLRSAQVEITPLAVASTEFTLILPPCTIHRIETVTTTLFTGATAALRVGTSLGGEQIVANVSVLAVARVSHTVVAAGAKFAGGTVFVRLAQTTPTAVGRARTIIEYSPD
jgi:hypothetical protein